MNLLQRFRPPDVTVRINADRAAQIDALAPDRSRLSLLPREMSPEMRKGEQRIDRRMVGEETRVSVVRKLLAQVERESGRILWRTKGESQ